MLITAFALIFIAGLIGLVITSPHHDKWKRDEHRQHLRNLLRRNRGRNV